MKPNPVNVRLITWVIISLITLLLLFLVPMPSIIRVAAISVGAGVYLTLAIFYYKHKKGG